MSLLEETLEILQENNKTEMDVLWCGSEKYGWFDFEHFKNIADVEYDDGYGAQEIAKDLIIVGKDFWLSRGEYDGSEWWKYNTFPIKPEIEIKPLYVSTTEHHSGCGWNTLEELNSTKIKNTI